MSGSALEPGFRYRLFGLTVLSEIEMPQLPAAPVGRVDLTISRTAIDHPRRREPGAVAEFGPAMQYLAWETVGAFRIRRADLIEVDPNAGVSDALVALPLLGSVMATLLHRRGLLVLHASAATLGGHGIALLGDKGAGKSTTAAALVAAGYTLLSDDVVALAFTGGNRIEILPAYGQLKLWDEAVAGLAPLPLREGGQLHPAIAKSQYGLTTGFSAEAAPLSRLYVLGRGDTAGVTMVEPGEGLTALLRYAYMARFGEAGFGPSMASYFGRAAALASAGKVRMLQVPEGVQRIGQAIAALEHDLDLRSVGELRANIGAM
ncbi:serine kinase [Devosia sp. 919]|uniref:serine kinase n=1 Tax=Devosia sp. 919 TaxID=2726065 RepID=UPI0015566424|nr:serine kinase [Devosia sp. 919]